MNFTTLAQSLTNLSTDNSRIQRETFFSTLPIGHTDPSILRAVAVWHAESAKRFDIMRADSARAVYHDSTAQRLFNLAEDLQRREAP
jgi:hypothetical protein